MKILQMNKNNPSFAEALKAIDEETNRRETKMDSILDSLRKEGNDSEANAIIDALRNTEEPLYRIYKALQNSGYNISYSAISTARGRVLKDA